MGIRAVDSGGETLEYKTEKITFRVTPGELRAIEEKAKKSNLKVSEYVRRSSLDKKIVVIEEIKEFTKELKGIGKNINQLLILVHQGKIEVVNEKGLTELKEKVNEIWRLLNLLMGKTK